MLSVQLIINYVRGLMIVVVVFWGEGLEWGGGVGVGGSLFIRPSADCNRTAMFVSV